MPIVLDPVNGITQATWTTAGRPGSPVAGQVGFNTSLNALEQYTGSSWETIPTWTTSNRPTTPAAGYSGYNTDTKAFEFYNGTTWIGFNQSNLSTTASYLLVAGGGGGGSYGGGGAGGYLTGTTTLNQNTTYFITVGGGGSGGAAAAGVKGTNGADSSLSGAGLTTITSTGGGGGGGDLTGISGGSGGGGGYGQAGGSGTPGQGYAGGTGTSPSFAGGGGGGSSAIGSNATPGNGGAGGNGTASSITGTSTTYAGGGGGGGLTAGANGGTGGGGKGSSATSSNNTAGNSNTGGGGGGGRDNTGSAGGSGVAIISYPGSQVFTGGTVTTSGGNTIHTFTTSAALLPTTNGSTFNNSLRFRGSNNAYLSRTPASAGNRKTWTWSAWIKLGTISVNMGTLLGVQGQTAIYVNDGTNSSFRVNGAAGSDLITSMMPRDPSAWYHLVVACDTTQAIETNRLKIYVNGVQQTAFQAGSAYPTLNGDTYFNSTSAHYIGRRVWNNDQQYDGYMTNVNFIDGQALSPAYFGTNNSNGVWVPVPYTGTYGTNGFFLNFGDGPFLTTSSNTGIGKDSSGNGNYWATNNISVTTGSTFDLMTDVPTLTSATAANYAVLNTLDKTAGTVSNGNLTIVKGSTGALANIRGTMSVSSGKWYFETTLTSGINYSTIGILSPDVAFPSQIGDSAYGWDWYPAFAEKKNNAVSTAYGTTASAGDIIMCAFDVTNGKIWWGKNGTWFASGDPAAGTNAAFTNVTGTVAPAVAVSGTTTQIDTNFGQRPFAYTPPSGFVALNTYNLSTPTILQGNLYMDATLYNGNNTTNVIVNQAGFKPDLVWIKARNAVSYHGLTDSVRGRAFPLFSNSTDAEGTSASDKDLISFNSNGFTVGIGNQYNSNGSGNTLVGWQWQAGQGTTSSNTAGSISSTTSVSTTAGFSVVTFTATGSNATVGHGLGVAPKMIITKQRNVTGSWATYHESLGNTKIIYLDSTGAALGPSSAYWNNTSPTSTVFTFGGALASNTNTIVAYCWAEIAGFSKFGSYTGNSNVDGPFVYLGFRPKWILIKQTVTNGYDWSIFDTSRSPSNVITVNLWANLTNAEYSNTATTGLLIDAVANGFKIRGTNVEINESGSNFIYAAFAENPFKYANAR